MCIYLKCTNKILNISFITEIVKECTVVDKSFFDTSTMDVLDTWKHLKTMDYITENGIHRGFMIKYIKEFPCDYVDHNLFNHIDEYFDKRNLDFGDFECVFKLLFEVRLSVLRR